MISLGIVTGRVAGLARDVLLAHAVGAGAAGDIAVLALSFPDLLTTFLISGVVSAVLIPDFKSAYARSGSRRLLAWITVSVGISSALIAVVAAVLAPVFVRLLGPGLPPSSQAAAAPLFVITSAVFPMTALAAVSTGYLQAHGRFAVPAAGTVIFNLSLVGAIALFVAPDKLGWLAAGAVIGSALRWGSQLLATVTIRDGMGETALSDLIGLAKRYPQAIGATSVIVLVPFVARTIASLGASGDVARLTYALRIVEFPLGAIVTVGSVAALPHLTELVISHRPADASRLLGSLLRLTIAVTSPLTIALSAVGIPVAALLYGRGAMTPEDVEGIGTIAAIALISLPAQGANAAFTAVYLANRTLGRAFVLNGAGLAVFTALALLLNARSGVIGIAVAYVALHWLLAAALYLDLRRSSVVPLPASTLGRLVPPAVLGAVAFAPFLAVLLLWPASPVVDLIVAGVGCIAAMSASLALALRSERRPRAVPSP